jgi:alpha-mannosidase
VKQNANGKTEIAITLLRCVGWLSREDLRTRKGHAGPGLETPGAQMAGDWQFDYAIIPMADASGLVERGLAYGFDAPMRSIATGLHQGDLPPTQAMVRIEPSEFQISAIKVSEDGAGWILRGYNTTSHEVMVKMIPCRRFANAEIVDLAEGFETLLKMLPDGSVMCPVQGFGIISVRFC